MKYRKKPVIVEAIQFTGRNLGDIKLFCGAAVKIEIYDLAWKIGVKAPRAKVVIHTLEGDMVVGTGDYIIRSVQGEYYPCKEDIFIATYDILDKVPAADVKPVVRGEWVGDSFIASFWVKRCSRCNQLSPVGDYCCICGADMREVENE